MSDRHLKRQTSVSVPGDIVHPSSGAGPAGLDGGSAQGGSGVGAPRGSFVLAANIIAIAMSLFAALAPSGDIALTATAEAATPPPQASQQVQPAATPSAAASNEPLLRVAAICEECAAFAHAASLVTAGNDLLAFWYQGPREGGFDASIQSSRFDGNTWSQPRTVANQLSVAGELGRFVKSLGNPVAYAAPDGKITLFFVSVAMRGWATAYIAYKQSDDGGRTWSRARALITSPVWNLSTMIKTTPFALPNGNIALPGYWELGTTYPTIIELSQDMRVVDVRRLSERGIGLQPAVIETGDGQYAAFLRTVSGQIGKTGLRRMTSNDGGQTWSTARETGFGNPGGPVSVSSLVPGRLALVFNDKKEDSLSIAFSEDGGNTWSRSFAIPAQKLERNRRRSYPYALADGKGVIDVVFSCGNYSICHTRFNKAWTEAQAAIGTAVK